MALPPFAPPPPQRTPYSIPPQKQGNPGWAVLMLIVAAALLIWALFAGVGCGGAGGWPGRVSDGGSGAVPAGVEVVGAPDWDPGLTVRQIVSQGVSFELVSAAQAQQITPVRQSKLPWRTVLSAVSGDQTSTTVFDTSSFASALVTWYGSGASACSATATGSVVWEINPLPAYIKMRVATAGGTHTVQLLGAVVLDGAYNEMGGIQGTQRIISLTSGTTCTYSVGVALVPISGAVTATGALGGSAVVDTIPNVNPVISGGLYRVSASNPYSVYPLRGDTSTEALWTTFPPVAASTATSPISVDSASTTTVFTFTEQYGRITAQNVGTVVLYCKTGLTANASSTDYQEVLAAATSADTPGGAYTAPYRAVISQIFSCRASGAGGKIAFHPHP